jgi:transcriptional regulator with XRE-family HTH domain
MSFKSIRDQRHLSQEKIADMSGLSLRTIQRLEAGHRVSYASLRALAVPLAMDVDLLERELYAVETSTDDFVDAAGYFTSVFVRILYKGFPLCQANESHRAAQRLDSLPAFAFLLLRHRASRVASICRAKVRTDKLQPVIDAALLVAERGRGP